MHYVRRIDQDHNDVRSNIFLVYKCSICGKEEWFQKVNNFDIERLRKCPNCGVENDTSNKEYLIKKKQELEQKIKSLFDAHQKALLDLEKVSMELEVVLFNVQKQKISEGILND